MSFGSVIRSLQMLSRRQLLSVLGFAFSTLILTGLDLLAILLLGAVATIATGGDSFLEGLSTVAMSLESSVLLLLVASALIFLAKSAGGLLIARKRAYFLAGLEKNFSDEITRSIFLSGLEKVKEYSRADLEWAILRSSSVAFGKLVGKALVLAAEFSLALAIAVLFLAVDWKSALLLVGYFIFLTSVFHVYTRRRVRTSGELFTDQSLSVMQAVADLVSAYREITVLGRMEAFIQRVSESREQAARQNAYYDYISSVPRLIVELGLILGALGFLGFQYWSQGGDLDYSLLGIFIVGSLRLMSAFLPIQNAVQELRFFSGQAGAALDLVEKSRREAKTLSLSPVQFESNPGRADKGPAIELNDVHFSHQSAPESDSVLKAVSMRIESGQTAAIIGPSGAGKSTLIDLIMGIYSPTQGTILVGGRSPADFRQSRPGCVAYVPQKPGLIAGTIVENIALGVPGDAVDEEALRLALNNSELDGLIDSLPDGVATDLGKHADGLSGGQIQRIGLARALYTRPKLIVLDESTSALDAETEFSISTNLSRLPERPTLVIVAHRLSTVQDADVVFLMESGRLLAEGKLSTLIRDEPIVANYVELMSIRNE